MTKEQYIKATELQRDIMCIKSHIEGVKSTLRACDNSLIKGTLTFGCAHDGLILNFIDAPGYLRQATAYVENLEKQLEEL